MKKLLFVYSKTSMKPFKYQGKLKTNYGTNGVLLYFEGKVQLKHFYNIRIKIKIILRTQNTNCAAFVSVSETGFVKAGKLLPAFLVGLKMAARLGGIENMRV